MRMRQKPWANGELVTNPYAISGATFIKWSEVFGNDWPLHLEIGMGKGGFITKEALINQDTNFIGLERQKSVCAVAARKLTEAGLNNVRLLYGDAERLPEYFASEEVKRIYINFCDPWPKARTYKRRLTYRSFLEKYKEVLKSGGLIIFKTDNLQLYKFSLNEFAHTGFNILDITENLHERHEADNPFPHNTTTEYEERFSALGVSICRITAEKPLEK